MVLPETLWPVQAHVLMPQFGRELLLPLLCPTSGRDFWCCNGAEAVSHRTRPGVFGVLGVQGFRKTSIQVRHALHLATNEFIGPRSDAFCIGAIDCTVPTYFGTHLVGPNVQSG